MTNLKNRGLGSIIERKKQVLKKFYGGKRESYHHDFALSNGKCDKCKVFIGDASTRICPVIGREEVEQFRDWGFGEN